jgi:2-oxoglutarate ferredoxin oxidoreductase subunit gamma
MLYEIVIAGFGGQGVMLMGQILANAGMIEDKEVAWIPSYGPEMRGGTANCTVTISSQEISSPMVSKPGYAIVMNKPSLLKFEPLIKPEGYVLVNTSLVKEKGQRKDLFVYGVPCNNIANDLGNTKVANMVMLGAFLQKTNAVKPYSVIESLGKLLGPKKQSLVPINKTALEAGAEYAIKLDT